MNKQIITVYLKERPYHLTVTIEDRGEERIYKVSPEGDAEELEGYVPANLEFDVDGTVQFDERVRTVEGELVARTIWKAINDQINGKS